MTVDLPNLAATETFGRRLGSLLFPGAIVALIGPLGAGKTHLARAIAEGLGIDDPTAVTSPTFVLIQEYSGRIPVYHFDAYRLASGREFAGLGVEEYFSGNGVCLVEWADRVPEELPVERLSITLEIVGERGRRAIMTAIGTGYEDVFAKLV